MQDMLVIDGLQYSNWSEALFRQMREGGLSAVHATIAYHETARETLSRIGEWNRRFEAWPELIRPVRQASDITLAQREGRVGVFFGFQNCSPIEDDIDLVEVFRQLGVFVMQLTYNNQSLLASGCYESEDNGISRFGRQVIGEMNRVGMLIDMSHSAERSTLQAIELSARPVIISRQPQQLPSCPAQQVRCRVARDRAIRGLLGFSTYPFHLRGGPACRLDEFCDMVARTADLMGVDHIGIGTDLCQQQPLQVLEWMRNGRWSKAKDYGEGSAANADWPAPLPRQPGLSRDRGGPARAGFVDDELRRIMGLNWLHQLEQGTAPRP